MHDIIKLLPDHVANQIAAGEVIQRPASAVKELMENAVDSGADTVKLIVKDAGKTLIQVIDNGCGMSETDARMCWERHATSKISNADDLFRIHTKGFRGEALASIGAVAQVELKTRRHEDETGTLLQIEGSEVKLQEQTATPGGSNISVRNLFFNVPARRNFLKSNGQEMRHIIEEFQRIAMAHPELNFTMHHDGIEIFNLKSGNFRQRICGIFGGNYNERLVPVSENTDVVNINGFIIKPEFAKKTRGEQYFFANNRFIRDSYLNHAIVNAYDGMMPKDLFPSYFINIHIDPAKIDVNVHPTKTEIKFEDERMMYAFMRAAAKHALGKFSAAPSLDFDTERSFEIPLQKLKELPVAPQVMITPGYNPFKKETAFDSSEKNFERKPVATDWRKLYEGLDQSIEPVAPAAQQMDLQHATEIISGDEIVACMQIEKQFIVCMMAGKIFIVDQQAAHERIIFEKQLNSNPNTSMQHQLFPQTITLSADDAFLMEELEQDLRNLGFDINAFGANSFVLHAGPAFIEQGKQVKVIESLLEQYKHNSKSFHTDRIENIARSIARSLSVKTGQPLSEPEMKNLVSDLFKSNNSTISPDGKPTFVLLNGDGLKKLIGN